MKKTKVTKYRLILSLSDQDVAFEPLYSELKEIEHKYSNSEAVNNEKRKLFLRILLAYCSTHSRNPSKAYANVQSSAATVDPPPMMAPSPPPTPPPDTDNASEEVTPSLGLHKPDGSISFGKFHLKTY